MKKILKILMFLFLMAFCCYSAQALWGNDAISPQTIFFNETFINFNQWTNNQWVINTEGKAYQYNNIYTMNASNFSLGNMSNNNIYLMFQFRMNLSNKNMELIFTNGTGYLYQMIIRTYNNRANFSPMVYSFALGTNILDDYYGFVPVDFNYHNATFFHNRTSNEWCAWIDDTITNRQCNSSADYSTINNLRDINDGSTAYQEYMFDNFLIFNSTTSNTAPALTVTSPVNNEHNNSMNLTAGFTYNDPEGDLGNVSLYVNGIRNNTLNMAVNPTTSTIGLTTLLSTDGNYTWFLQACDTVGACTNSTSAVYILDTIAPIITWISPFTTANTEVTGNNNLSLKLTVQDSYLFLLNITVWNISNQSEYSVKYLNATVNNLSFTTLEGINFSKYGNYTINVSISDSQRTNTVLNDIQEYVRYYYYSPPLITVSNPPDNDHHYLRNITAGFTYNDPEGDLGNVSLYVDGIRNNTLNIAVNPTTSTIGLTTNLTADGNYTWFLQACDRLGCTNSTPRTYIFDRSPPILVWVTPFIAKNTELIRSTNITPFKVTVRDEYLFRINVTVYNGTEILFNYSYENDTVSGGNEYNFTENMNFSGDGNFTIVFEATDSHTGKEIPNYNYTIDEKGILYGIGDNWLRISALTVPAEISAVKANIKTQKFNDRYRNSWDYNSNLTKNSPVTFKVQSNAELTQIKNSAYPAHFVFGKNWVDFAMKEQSKYEIEQISKNEALITIRQTNMKFEFESVGGLNNVSGVVNYVLDTAAPSLVLNFPFNDSTLNYSDVTFSYNISDLTSGIKNCSLEVNGVIKGVDTTITEGTQTIDYSFSSNGNYVWYIFCFDDAENVNSSVMYNLTIAVPAASGGGSVESGGGGTGQMHCLDGYILNGTYCIPIQEEQQPKSEIKETTQSLWAKFSGFFTDIWAGITGFLGGGELTIKENEPQKTIFSQIAESIAGTSKTSPEISAEKKISVNEGYSLAILLLLLIVLMYFGVLDYLAAFSGLPAVVLIIVIMAICYLAAYLV